MFQCFRAFLSRNIGNEFHDSVDHIKVHEKKIALKLASSHQLMHAEVIDVEENR